jgi:hypothetical protein
MTAMTSAPDLPPMSRRGVLASMGKMAAIGAAAVVGAQAVGDPAAHASQASPSAPALTGAAGSLRVLSFSSVKGATASLVVTAGTTATRRRPSTATGLPATAVGARSTAIPTRRLPTTPASSSSRR